MSKIKEKISTWYHSKTKKQLILGSIFMVALPIGAGVAAGLVINKFFIGKTADYSGLDATELSTDVNSVYKKYENCKAQGKEYSEVLKSYEMVNVAYKLFGDSEKCRSITIGNANAAIVDQSIKASSFKVGNEYLEESISKSNFVSLAARTYLHTDNSIEFLDGKAITTTEGEWPNEHYNFTVDEYEATFGKTPKTPLIYIISKKTVINEVSFSKTSEGYTIDLELDPLRSVLNYVKQMKSISKLADYPAFESVHTIFKLDNDLMIKTLDVTESYYAKTGAVGADITAHQTITYEVNDSITIPDLNTKVNYGDYEK